MLDLRTSTMQRTAIPNRLQGGALDDLGNGTWRLWLHTRDWCWGTYLVICADGSVTQVTTRPDVGDEVLLIKPANM